MEFDGVVVEDTSDLHTKAWLQLSDEEGKSRPLQFALKRADGMKNEQVLDAPTTSLHSACQLKHAPTLNFCSSARSPSWCPVTALCLQLPCCLCCGSEHVDFL